MIRVVLPAHLRTLVHIQGEVELDIDGAVTQQSVLDTLEAMYPVLRGTIRDQRTQRNLGPTCSRRSQFGGQIVQLDL